MVSAVPSKCLMLAVAILFLMAVGASSREARFPLRIAAGGTHLEDVDGTPFLIVGDAAWSLIADLPKEEVDRYIADRKARGFNTILVSLIEREFARNAPNNIDDIPPFLTPGDFSKPNDRYFAAAEYALDAAQAAGLLVLLTPAYLGANGGPQGWYTEMVAAGPPALQAYGRYIGKRYGRYPNIIWVQGGDYDPPDRALVDALATGIMEGAPGALQTVHGGRDTTTSAYWPDAPWLGIDTVYTYENVAAAALSRYRAGPRRPFFVIESRYEGEHGVEASEVRKIAYGALLSGACGQVYGNNPVWHFGGPALHPTPMTWQAALGSKGAESIGHLSAIFRGIDWWKLTPDGGRMVKETTGAPTVAAIAAIASDASFAIVYVYDASAIEIDLDALESPGGEAVWYDPSTGGKAQSTSLDGKAGPSRLSVPASANASGATDWLLVVRAGE